MFSRPAIISFFVVFVFAEFGCTTAKETKVLENTCTVVSISGRVGSNTVVNGEYTLVPSKFNDGRPIYRRWDVTNNVGVYLYYIAEVSAWLIGQTVGSYDCYGYILADISEPFLPSPYSWQVFDGTAFTLDPSVTAACQGPCASHTSGGCADCLALSTCGWCFSTHTCRFGSSSGALLTKMENTSCAQWAFYGESCTSSAPYCSTFKATQCQKEGKVLVSEAESIRCRGISCTAQECCLWPNEPCRVIRISGRVGLSDFINGDYFYHPGSIYNGRPYYSRLIDASAELYLHIFWLDLQWQIFFDLGTPRWRSPK